MGELKPLSLTDIRNTEHSPTTSKLTQTSQECSLASVPITWCSVSICQQEIYKAHWKARKRSQCEKIKQVRESDFRYNTVAGIIRHVI